MDAQARRFLEDVLVTPSPSGFEGPVQALVRRYAAGFADQVSTDVHGNLIAAINPDAPRRFMLAGHCDQIGLLVASIDDLGFLYCQTIGGWDPQQLVGQHMLIWTRQGPLPGVIACKPIHLLNEQERKQVVRIEDLWLDIGAADREQAESLVKIGDPVTLHLGMRALHNGLVSGPKMDNASGLWVVVEALRRAASRSPNWGVFAVSTVQEEIGLRGARTSAFAIDPHAAVAVDVTHATDCPTIDPRQLGSLKLGRGPVVFRGPNINPKMSELLEGLAIDHGIAIQSAAIGRGASNDANALQINRSGVATGLVSIPNRYMHSAVETVSLGDLDAAAELLALLACSLDESTDFTPG